MSTFVSEQLSVSTAQEESDHFTGQPLAFLRPDPNAALPPGVYRVVEGVAPAMRVPSEEIQAL